MKLVLTVREIRGVIASVPRYDLMNNITTAEHEAYTDHLLSIVCKTQQSLSSGNTTKRKNKQTDIHRRHSIVPPTHGILYSTIHYTISTINTNYHPLYTIHYPLRHNYLLYNSHAA